MFLQQLLMTIDYDNLESQLIISTESSSGKCLVSEWSKRQDGQKLL
jgi:hypothetical protein